jgi:hypothetical protein
MKPGCLRWILAIRALAKGSFRPERRNVPAAAPFDSLAPTSFSVHQRVSCQRNLSLTRNARTGPANLLRIFRVAAVRVDAHCLNATRTTSLLGLHRLRARRQPLAPRIRLLDRREASSFLPSPLRRVEIEQPCLRRLRVNP